MNGFFGDGGVGSLFAEVFQSHDAGVVNQDVELRVFLPQLRGEGLDTGGAGDIEDERLHPRIGGRGFVDRLRPRAAMMT